MTETEFELSPGYRLDLIVRALSGIELRSLLDKLDSGQLVEAHDFLWDKLVELFYETQEGEFDRAVVTAQMTPSAQYQKEQNCDLRLEYCKGVECVWSNPECAGNKIKNHMEVMARVIHGYVRSEHHTETAVRPNPFLRVDNAVPDLLSRP
jgi:hypothetical protein